MDLTPFIKAVEAKQWALLGALVVGALIALSKQGWLSELIAKKLTPSTTQWYAMLVSVLTVGSSEIVAGKPWQQALTDAGISAITAIAGHQLLIEGIRRGRELVPATNATVARKLAATAPDTRPPPPCAT